MGWLLIALLLVAVLVIGLVALWRAAARRLRQRGGRGSLGPADDDVIEWVAETVRQRAEHRRNVSALRHQCGTPIEQLAADVRRLRRIIATDASASAVHQLGHRLAYDLLLMECCAMLGVDHELDQETVGHDRDIERLRVEAELERAGLVFTTGFGRAA